MTSEPTTRTPMMTVVLPTAAPRLEPGAAAVLRRLIVTATEHRQLHIDATAGPTDLAS